jgi:hypothetical protein
MPAPLDEPVGSSDGGQVSPSERVVIGMDPVGLTDLHEPTGVIQSAGRRWPGGARPVW